MNEWNIIHENFHTKQRAHSARCTHAYITQLYIMSIQPATKAVEHLVSSYKREREREEGIKRERESHRHSRDLLIERERESHRHSRDLLIERERVTQTQQRLAHRERERERDTAETCSERGWGSREKGRKGERERKGIGQGWPAGHFEIVNGQAGTLANCQGNQGADRLAGSENHTIHGFFLKLFLCRFFSLSLFAASVNENNSNTTFCFEFSVFLKLFSVNCDWRILSVTNTCVHN